MKGVACILTAWTSWGARCYYGEFPSMNAAREEGRWLVDNGYAFSYRITKKAKQ